MIDRDHKLSVSKLCAALGISRGSVAYCIVVSDLVLMRWRDELNLEHADAGAEGPAGYRWKQD